jgi:hypothetical protein
MEKLTFEEFNELIEEIDKDGWLDKWDEWWAAQTPAFQKMFDDAMKAKVKEYCNEE